MSEDKHRDLIHQLRPGKIILPVVIGLGVIIWLFARDFSMDAMREINFIWSSAFWLFIAFLFVILRTFSYMARIRVMTENRLSWLKSFRVIMLWEFTSAITPSTVGGTAFAVIFLSKEGLSVGKSTAVVLATFFLDELYFIILLPLLLILVGGESIFITSLQGTGTGLLNNLIIVAIIGYLIILSWVLLVGYGLFIKPEAIKNLLIKLFSLPFLKRWKESAIRAGNDIILSSTELKNKPKSFWWKSFLHTFNAWTSRYLVLNAILVAFFVINDHLLIFARQFVLWIMMILSPTPGGSGFAEVILGRYLTDLIPVDPAHAGGVALAMALIWRIITYYPFLIAGVLIIPGWIQRNFIKPFIKK